jgi:hypothetical protein
MSCTLFGLDENYRITAKGSCRGPLPRNQCRVRGQDPGRALQELERKGMIRILDLLFVHKVAETGDLLADLGCLQGMQFGVARTNAGA